VAGLVFNDSCLTVAVRGAAEPGDLARVVTPHTSGAWPVVSTAVTSDDRRTVVDGIWSEGSRLRVVGSVPVRQEYTFDTPVPDPLSNVGGALLEVLSRAGVRVERGFRAAKDDADRAGGTILHAVEDDLASALVVMNRRSQNLYASLLFKACGVAREGRGTWESGSRAVAEALSRRGIGDAGRIVDGSGLARDSRVSAEALARLLVAFDRDAIRGPVLWRSLAVPGEEGTLQKRFTDREGRARVRAKTGTLARSGVHALAGYVDGRAGSRGFAFALILNQNPAGGDPRDLLDDVVREIIRE
jgi:PBP4 family serine-type D-alanyl-D-alanine carboxypeptidase